MNFNLNFTLIYCGGVTMFLSRSGYQALQGRSILPAAINDNFCR